MVEPADFMRVMLNNGARCTGEDEEHYFTELCADLRQKELTGA